MSLEEGFLRAKIPLSAVVGRLSLEEEEEEILFRLPHTHLVGRTDGWTRREAASVWVAAAGTTHTYTSHAN